MKWPSAGSGTEALSRTESQGPSSRRQALVESESLPEIYNPAPNAESGVLSENCNGVQESRGAGTRICASARPAPWQRGGTANPATKGGATASIAHAGRSFDVSRRRIGRVPLGAVRILIIRLLSKTSKSTVPCYFNDCLLQGTQHHHGSRLLAAVMDRWPSSSRFGSRKLPRFHRCSKRRRQLTPGVHPSKVGACAGRHCSDTLLNQPLMAGFIPIVLVTYMRPSELLTLRKRDLAPPLISVLPFWSVVIAASETGVSTKTGVRDGSVLIDQRIQCVNKLLPSLNDVADVVGMDVPEVHATRLPKARCYSCLAVDNVPVHAASGAPLSTMKQIWFPLSSVNVVHSSHTAGWHFAFQLLRHHHDIPALFSPS